MFAAPEKQSFVRRVHIMCLVVVAVKVSRDNSSSCNIDSNVKKFSHQPQHAHHPITPICLRQECMSLS